MTFFLSFQNNGRHTTGLKCMVLCLESLGLILVGIYAAIIIDFIGRRVFFGFVIKCLLKLRAANILLLQ